MGETIPSLLTMREVSVRLRVPLATLQQWRKVGYGPRGEKIGRRVMYLESDVAAWVTQQFAATGTTGTASTQDVEPQSTPVETERS